MHGEHSGHQVKIWPTVSYYPTLSISSMTSRFSTHLVISAVLVKDRVGGMGNATMMLMKRKGWLAVRWGSMDRSLPMSSLLSPFRCDKLAGCSTILMHGRKRSEGGLTFLLWRWQAMRSIIRMHMFVKPSALIGIHLWPNMTLSGWRIHGWRCFSSCWVLRRYFPYLSDIQFYSWFVNYRTANYLWKPPKWNVSTQENGESNAAEIENFVRYESGGVTSVSLPYTFTGVSDTGSFWRRKWISISMIFVQHGKNTLH